mmetsp:Transcript_56210/g.168290  ORF Transcript_56210/g.168290 Transcript_56210/m.168290 type:complete len:205 (-) Transcript_56210:64-678(-)
MCQQQQQIGALALASGAEIQKTLGEPLSVLKRTQPVGKKVSFCSEMHVEDTISRHDMSRTELRATWYDHVDLISILIEIKDAIDEVVDGLPPVECWLPWNRRRKCASEHETADICTRGLEHEIDQKARFARSANKKRMFTSVFHAQQKHNKLSIKISEISEKHSQQAKHYARKIGREDENIAADIYYQDIVRGMPLLDYDSFLQ